MDRHGRNQGFWPVQDMIYVTREFCNIWWRFEGVQRIIRTQSTYVGGGFALLSQSSRSRRMNTWTVSSVHARTMNLNQFDRPSRVVNASWGHNSSLHTR